MNSQRLKHPSVWSLLVLMTGLLGACESKEEATSAADAGVNMSSADAGTCNVPAEGCPCGPETRPEPCYPDSVESDEDGGVAMCHEGTRYCRDGAYTACLDVQSYEMPPRATAALVDQTSTHPQCSDCRPNCYRVVDDLAAIDGPLDATNSSGVEYDSTLGGGVKLTPSGGSTTPPPVSISVPPGSIVVPAPEGIPGSGNGAGSHHAPQADVYFMLDHANRMTVEIQSLYGAWNTGTYLPSGAQCVGGNATLASSGVAGALQCMITDSATGVGRFGDIPFDPYSTTLGTPDDYEVAYQNMSNLATNSTTAETAIANVFAAKESTGDPDLAGSAVPALYAMSTATGLNMGLGKANVPDPTACGAATDYGYPCYRAGSDRIVVMVTDAPMHNGPVNASYDYDPTNLSTVFGTAPAVAVPPTNDDFSSVYNMTPGPDASQILATYTGSTSTLTPVVPASEVNVVAACGADDLAPDAIFSFDVVDSGSPVPVTISTQGTSFQTTLSVHDGPIGGVTTLPASPNTNNLFSSAQDLGDLSGGGYRISGSTSAASITSGYQGVMFGQCGANTLAHDAVYRIANSGAQPLTLSLDAGGNRGALSVYDVAGGTYGQHQWLSNTEASNNLNTVGDFGNAHVISTGAGNEYLTVQGDTSAGTISADYDQNAFTNTVIGASCTVDPAAKDVIFEYDVTGAPKTVQFDTEGSSFDTVLALYDVLPISNSGPVSSTMSNNLNTDVPTVQDIGSINGRDVTYTGDTSTMTGNITDNIGCGFDNSSACGDAVYKFTVTERTTLRMDVTSGSYDAGLMVTRAAPDGAQGRYTSFSTGLAHTCAVSGGQVYCWGSNASGQLGGTPSSAGAPVLVTDGSNPLLDVVQVTAGRDHTCAITVGGDAYCWGANGGGQLGQPGPNKSVATQVTAINTSLPAAMQITAGDDFTCALLKDATIACWGNRTDGRLGTGVAAGGSSPPTRISSSDTFVMVEAGQAHACAIRTGDRAVRCWGNGGSGRLGNNSTANSATPVLVRTDTGGTLLTRASYISAGGQHSCATTTAGRGYCWGEGDYGRLGTGNTTDTSYAKLIQDVFGDIGGMHGGWAAGSTHTCITNDQGFVLCFGRDNLGQLGDDASAANQSKPVPVYGIVDGLEVVSNYDHTCALKRAGTLECWGAGGSRQLGNFGTANAFTPVVAHDGTASSQNVTFGTGYVDTGFSQACRSTAQAPDSGCTRKVNPSNNKAYFFCDNSVAQDWGQAGQTCRSIGMEFALPDEPGENAWIASNLPSGQSAWIGVARATDSNDWLTLTAERDFVDYNGNMVYDNTQEGGSYSCGLFGLSTCYKPNDGYFVGAYATAGLTKSLWGDLYSMPSSVWGQNCVQVTSSGNWQTADCTDMEDPASTGASCGGILGLLLCLVGAILFVTGSILGGASTWLGSSLQLLGQSLAGVTYSSPLVNGGNAAPFVCEESAQPTDLTLDPGEYYITVKGTVDPNTGVCDGDYTLQVQDLGSPTGGMLACDDNGIAEVTSSRITHTFNTNGKHYLVLKGRNAGSEGTYNLTVRETGVINSSELTCDLGTGSGDPATVTLAAGSDNYVMIKGDAPVDSGPYSLTVAGSGGGPTTLACDAVGNSSMTLNLATGTYYAVLKGKGPSESGNYQVQIGGATPTTGTYVPPTYADTVTALTSNNVRVATVVTCAAADPGCADAQAQAAALATDTSGVVRLAANESDVPSEVVAAVRMLETATKVQALDIVYSPDADPGFANVTVQAIADPSNQCAGLDGSDASMRTWLDCAPGASPGYVVSALNPATAPVAPSATGPGGAYQFTLPLEITLHDGSVVTQNIPVYVVPSAATASGTYGTGQYDQQFDSRGCDSSANLRPTWNEFTYSADVRPDTELVFYGCTADSTADLSTCGTGSSSSGYKRFLTVTAGSGSGTSCTVLTESVDCGSDGFCNTAASGGVLDATGNLIGTCNYLEGASCTADPDCPGAVSGSCRSTGPSFSTLGKTCRVFYREGNPASALGADDGRPFMHMKADLVSSGSGTRTPTLYNWEMIYNCQAVE